MRILVTGGAGFIGSNLIHYLLGEANSELNVEIEKVVNLDKLTYAGNPQNLSAIERDPRYQFVEGDIGDACLVRKILEDENITAVMHLAAESHVDRSIETPEEFIMTNFVGTFQMLHAANAYHRQRMEQGKGDDFRFLHVSTDEVYGSLSMEDPAFSETTPYAPNSPYSASKAGSDHLARAYFHTFNLPVITTNCSNNYGPYQFPEKLIPLMVTKARRGEKLPVYGDGSNIRDWLFVKDHCRGLFLSLMKGRPGEVYNIGGNCEMKNIDVVRAIISTVNSLQADADSIDVDAMIEFVTDRPGHDHRYAIDCSKIESELGWQPKENFASGLLETVKWYFDNDDWSEAVEKGTYQGQRMGILNKE